MRKKNTGMKIRNQEIEILAEDKGTKARRKKKEKKISGKKLGLILHYSMTKKYTYVELVSGVASGLVPALKLRQKINSDRERGTGRERKKTKTNARLVLSPNLKPTLSSRAAQTSALLKT